MPVSGPGDPSTVVNGGIRPPLLTDVICGARNPHTDWAARFLRLRCESGPGRRSAREDQTTLPPPFRRSHHRGTRYAGDRHTIEDGWHVGSVIKKRRKRMAKKKHRKLLKRTRVQRRNKK